MNLTDIENLTAAQLKAQSIELSEEAAKSDPKELAKRYIKARIDAATRDEKLAEQGKTITSLNEALEAQKKLAATAEAQATDFALRLRKAGEDAKATAQAIQATASERDAAIHAAQKAQAIAKARRAALVDVLDFAAQLNARVGKLLVSEE